jgi:hypothetical protein
LFILGLFVSPSLLNVISTFFRNMFIPVFMSKGPAPKPFFPGMPEKTIIESDTMSIK